MLGMRGEKIEVEGKELVLVKIVFPKTATSEGRIEYPKDKVTAHIETFLDDTKRDFIIKNSDGNEIGRIEGLSKVGQEDEESYLISLLWYLDKTENGYSLHYNEIPVYTAFYEWKNIKEESEGLWSKIGKIFS